MNRQDMINEILKHLKTASDRALNIALEFIRSLTRK